MTTERLEELARKCEESLSDYLTTWTQQDIADLARCARAWAKLEHIIRGEDGYSVDLWRMRKGHIRLITNSQAADAPTAIEAVEAAEVE